MFSLVRSGPKMLILQSSDVAALRSYLMDKLGAGKYEFSSALEKAGEDSTILFLTEQLKDIVAEKEIIDTLILAEEPDVLLCKLINDKQTSLLDGIRTAPRIIMVRALGDLQGVIQEIQSDLGGSIGTMKEILNSRNEKGTLVTVTDKPLHRNMQITDTYEKCLFIEQSFYPLFKSLRLHALKYMNKGIDNKDWHEIEVRIYDRYSAYMLHYERLAAVFDYLELGLILGESWTKDYPRPFMAVGVYRLRFFTLYDPKLIKKMLVGLEYLQDGTRIVDFDIYFQRKKMDWTDALQPGDPRTRHGLGLKYREEIYARLSAQEAAEIQEQEEEILKTRY